MRGKLRVSQPRGLLYRVRSRDVERFGENRFWGDWEPVEALSIFSERLVEINGITFGARNWDLEIQRNGQLFWEMAPAVPPVRGLDG